MNDPCEHYIEHFPLELVAKWLPDLICGEVDWVAKSQALLRGGGNTMAEVMAKHGMTGEEVRAMLEPQVVIPLPATGLLLVSALALLLVWRKA